MISGNVLLREGRHAFRVAVDAVSRSRNGGRWLCRSQFVHCSGMQMERGYHRLRTAFPREAVDFLTQVGGVALSVYYVAIAYVLYKVISRRRYLHRFLISLAVFAIAALAAIITCGADILHLGNALAFGRRGGDFVALGGFLFASFYRSPTQNQEA